MPYTKKQKALFHAMANDPKVAKAHGSTQDKAKALAKESESVPTRKPIKSKRGK